MQSFRFLPLVVLYLSGCASDKPFFEEEVPGPDAGMLDGGPGPTTCMPAAPRASYLFREAGLEPYGLASDGGQLYFGVRPPGPGLPMIPGALYRIPSAGGKPTLVADKDYVSGPVRLGQNFIASLKAELIPVGMGVAVHYPKVLVRDKTTLALTQLVNPRMGKAVSGLIVSTSGIYWGSNSATMPRVIARFDPATQKITELASLDNYSDIFTDDTTLYYARWQGAEVHFEGVPISGQGSPTVVMRLPLDVLMTPLLLGVDESQLYFTANAAAGMIEAVSKTGGPSTPLVTVPGGIDSVVMDATHLYFRDPLDQARLLRVSKQGGMLQEMAPGNTGLYIQQIALDSCNVYWSVVNPPQLLVRAKS